MESRRSQSTNFLILDSGYPLEPWLLKPYVGPATAEEILFNRLRSVRSTIERCNGVLKSRFRCLHQIGGCLVYTPYKMCQIILVCAVLHSTRFICQILKKTLKMMILKSMSQPVGAEVLTACAWKANAVRKKIA
ncbi:hypothetical protein JTE90_003428 [Oedothorax gibbosus]|uniref:DDE Tnp4 domain-containing protein n=1 Tax=Oedothorax gibbosus TaxID=931172 RepID=A0AAV6TXT6_9ARAC|nr:hypothetical protein JTE90_003428 [Oedothorax gibbosus]